MRADAGQHRAEAVPPLYGDASGFALRPLRIPDDIPMLHRWFTQPRAVFWQMQDKSEDEVRQSYQALSDSGHASAYIGLYAGRAAFLAECYDPAHDRLREVYAVRPGDLGMHIFVGPSDVRIAGFTRAAFAALMRFMFAHLGALRIVVEPDARNHRIHALNRSAGFVCDRDVVFTEKIARLAFCTRRDFEQATATTLEAVHP